MCWYSFHDGIIFLNTNAIVKVSIGSGMGQVQDIKDIRPILNPRQIKPKPESGGLDSLINMLIRFPYFLNTSMVFYLVE